MPAYHPLILAGVELWLLAEKAIYWPARRALLVADIHFGKAAAFRALGQPVPHGTTAGNIARLDSLLALYDCQEIIFLGDFLHAPASRAPLTLDTLERWREHQAHLRLLLIRGNHDRRAGDPPTALGIDVVGEPLELDGLSLQHEPDPHPRLPVLAGHIHPAFRLQGRGRQALRLPCFCLENDEVLILPAFGDFTGGHLLAPDPARRIFVVGDGGIWPLR